MVLLGLVKDTLPCLAAINRLSVELLMALLDGVAGSAHAVAATKLGDGGGDLVSDVASVSGTSTLSTLTVASVAEGAAHRTIDHLHGTTKALLSLSRQVGCGSLQCATDLLDRAGVNGGVVMRIALGCETSEAFREARANFGGMLAELSSRTPFVDDLRFEDIAAAAHALALLQSATARRPVARAEWATDAAEELLLTDCLAWMLASYGRTMVVVERALGPLGRALGLLPQSSRGAQRRPAPTDDLEAIGQKTGIDVARDLLAYEPRAAAHRPAYLLGVHPRRRCLVLAVRGTWQLVDLITDLDCRPVPCSVLGQHGHAHRGMYEAARRLDVALRETVVAALAARPGHGLVLTGHSMGGGVASILTALWGPSLAVGPGDVRDVRCYVFGPLGSLTLPLAHAAARCVTSVVNAQDMVPRLSFASVTNLRAALVALAHEGRERGLVHEGRRATCDDQCGGGGGGGGGDLVARVLARLSGGAALTDEDAQWAESILVWLRQSNEELYVEELLPAGRVLWVPPDEPATDEADATAPDEPDRESAGARRWHRLVACANASSFNEVQLGVGMLLAHVPQAYAKALHHATRPAGGAATTGAAAG